MDYDPCFSTEPANVFRALFYGLGSDGTVSANKNSIKIIGEETNSYAQGYFVYDSKKAGAVTVSHLRFGPSDIHSTYLINKANFVACHQFVFLERYDILRDAEPGATFLPGGTETYVLCRSSSRREKEKAIRRRFSERLEQALGRLHQGVAQGRLKDRTKIQQALASLRARHPRVADLYQMSVVEREGTLQVEWQLIEERRAWREAREGTYLLRTNLAGESAQELWNKYIQLTEAAFRVLKSALWIRPLFHQLERRVKAHILVAFLGYALWVTLKHLLQRKNSGLSPDQALALLSTLQSADIVLPTTDGREIRLRRVATPDLKQQQLLDQLGITVPKDLELNFECSVDSAEQMAKHLN